MSWLAQNPEVICTELEEGAVLLNMETRTYYSLNDPGREIWGLVEITESPEDLARALCGLFTASEDQALALVSPFLERLRTEHLLVERTEEPSSRTAGGEPRPATKKALLAPELIQHDEPLHEVPVNPFDPQLPLAE